jgi:hypothetical protein
MMQTLTEDQSREYNISLSKDIEDWWSDLSISEKKSIYDYHKPMFLQIKCSHEFNKINFYSEKIEHCHKCNYNRSISDARNEKINDLI